MPPIKHLSRVVAAFALATTAAVSHAALTTHTTSASFAAATIAAATDTFDDIAADIITSPATRSAGAYGYEASAPSDLFGVLSGADAWLGTNNSFDTLTLSNFTGGASAIGGSFFATNLDGDFFPGQTVIVTATDSFGATAQRSYIDAMLSDFVGFTSTGTITSLTIQITTSPDEAFATVNDLVLAQTAPTAPIPEPATYGMLLAGLGALAFVRRRRSA